MARLNKKEEDLKIDALWISYEEFEEAGIDAPSYDMVTKRANKRDEVKKCNKPIGAKTLAQSKNKRLIELREKIKSKKNKVAKLKALAPTELSIKIEQLHSSLEANAILASNIENLEKRLINKDEILEGKETRITELSKEIEDLRAKLKQVKV